MRALFFSPGERTCNSHDVTSPSHTAVAVGELVSGMPGLKALPRNRSANKELADAIAAAALIDNLNIESLDDVTDEQLTVQDRTQLDLSGLQLLRPIGVGGQAGVWLAEDQSSGVRCAVKQVRKGRLAALPRKSAMRVFTEKECLEECKHPFVTRLFGTFQDGASLYFCLELVRGGDLFGLIDLFPNGLQEMHARFYTATIALALRHIHSRGYVYRDVKLENVLIGSDGYVKLCDFGFAKAVSNNRTFTKCGTDEYAPPEVVSGHGRSTAADWWGLGILLHEMLTGRPPFEGHSAQDIFDRIEAYTRGGEEAAQQLAMQLQLANRVKRSAEALSPSAGEFMIGLLRARESERIGCGPEGFIAIQRDPWFASLDWAALLRKQVEPPWVPPSTPDGAAASDAEFSTEGVMRAVPFDANVWAPIFDAFGPTLSSPILPLGVGDTPSTRDAIH